MNVLQWLEQNRHQAVISRQKLAGLTACSEQVTLANGECYVFRQQSQKATDYGIDYALEATLLKTIAPLNLSPTTIYSDNKSHLLTWIEGDVPNTFNDLILTKLAENLARLHLFDWQAVELLRNFAKLDLAQRCQFLWDKLTYEQQASLPFSPPFPNIQPFHHAICHHDIHLGNLVKRGDKLFLIDWEYAAISDPALELCLFLQANALSETQQALFFETYFAKTGFDRTACMQKIKEYQPESDKLSQMWYLL